MRAVRKPLWMLLAGTGVAAAAALWWPNPAQVVVAAAHEQARLSRLAGTLHAVSAPAGDRYRLPGELPVHLLEAARFDPFAGVVPPVPPPAVASTPQPLVGPVYEPPPAPPALNYRYLGQMLDTEGQRRVYLARPDKDIAVVVGMQLEEGYVVEAITEQGVQLHYPPARSKAVIPVPPSDPAGDVSLGSAR